MPVTMLFGMVTRIGRKKPRVFLREWREYREQTQQQLADRLGVSKATVSRHESGTRDLNTSQLAELAAALDTEPGNLFRDPQAPTPDELLRDLAPDVQRQAIAVIQALKRTGSGG